MEPDFSFGRLDLCLGRVDSGRVNLGRLDHIINPKNIPVSTIPVSAQKHSSLYSIKKKTIQLS